jgi:hypothetical protein
MESVVAQIGSAAALDLDRGFDSNAESLQNRSIPT